MLAHLGGTAATIAVLLAGPALTPATFLAETVEAEAVAFARERSITIDAATQRLEWQQAAPDLASRLATDLSARFGGVWIDVHDGDRVKVGVVGGADPPTYDVVRRAALGVGLIAGWDLVPVRYSAQELDRHNAWLGAEIARVNAGAAAGLTAGLRTDLNAIELQTPSGAALTSSQAALVAEATARLGSAVTVSSYTGRPQPWACNYPYCDKPLRGGIRIWGSLHGCTGGFIARSRTDAKLYQFTAGHCIDGGANDDWWTKYTNGVGHTIGDWHHWKWASGGDMAIIHINDEPGWDPKGWVQVTSGPDTTADSEYHLSSDNLSVIGMRICITGSYYGNSNCGEVTHLGVTVTYGDEDGWVTVHNMGRSTACGTPGDSGAPMYSYHVAYGLVMGGYSECQSFYQGIRGAEDEMNVDVVHAWS
jgi:hypothetical protein